METCYFSEFVDIADLILHGDNECIALPILPFQEIPRENYEEISVADLEVTGNVLTPCFYFIEEFEDSQALNDFELNYQEQIEELVIEELQMNQEYQDDSQFEDQVHGLDLLDVLQRQYQRLLQKNIQQSSKKDFLSSSTSVSGEVNAQKTDDFEHMEFEENADYPFQTRRDKVERYLRKRKNRNWNKKISYKCRKEVADSRLRVKGRFITRVQANKLLGINTNNMSVDLIRTLLESKFGKEKDPEAEDLSDKHL